MKKRLFYFSPRFPTRINFSVSKMQIPKSLHPTTEHWSDNAFYSCNLVYILEGTLYRKQKQYKLVY